MFCKICKYELHEDEEEICSLCLEDDERKHGEERHPDE